MLYILCGMVTNIDRQSFLRDEYEYWIYLADKSVIYHNTVNSPWHGYKHANIVNYFFRPPCQCGARPSKHNYAKHT